MELALAFIGAPVLTYLVLACIPRGRPALIGCLAALAIAGAVWVSQMGSTDSYLVALIVLVISAISLAGFVQVLRAAIGVGRPRWVYPLIVILALLGAGIPTLNVLGV
jgi:hypothetical protein